MFTVTTVNAGAVTAATYNVGTGTASPMNPASFFDATSPFSLNIGGTPLRSLIPQSMLMIAQARGRLPMLGELPISFAEPDRNFLKNNDATAWDMIGQAAFDVTMKLAAGLLNPTLSGSQEFDTLRNGYTSGNQFIPIVNPIWHASGERHSFAAQFHSAGPARPGQNAPDPHADHAARRRAALRGRLRDPRQSLPARFAAAAAT